MARRRGKRLKRFIVLLAGLMMSVLLGPVPGADALGLGACVISGTITFTPPDGNSAQGFWRINPAVINCQGTWAGPDRFIGPGPFTGGGSYTVLGVGGGACLHKVGKGTVDYVLRTSGTDVRISEPHEFVMAGAGRFTTPSLQGSFQETPPYDGDCLSKPVTRATFVAQALMVRTSR
jgi:hypothetical protein